MDVLDVKIRIDECLDLDQLEREYTGVSMKQLGR